MNRELKIGDKVAVMDIGLLQLMAIMPDSPPMNIGYVKEFLDDDEVMIEFPIGDEPMSEHSQISPYPKHMLRLTR